MRIRVAAAPTLQTIITLWIVALLAGGAQPQTAQIWTVPEVGALPDDANGLLVRRGRDLITATYAHIGPNVPDASQRYAGNNLACSNCHLAAGMRKFALPLFGLYGEFPQYSARSGTEITIEDRINSCMTRSMNGRPLPPDASQMRAIVAYIKFLSSGVPAGQQLPGLGAGKMPELSRAADPDRGHTIYARKCADCHNTDGSGQRRSIPSSDLGYTIPPLWGPDSFNDGAGMARLITIANFVHFNMPHGTEYLDPQLTTEEAWDVAAFIVSQPRPSRADFAHDFPDLLEKPVDTPYGPYAGSFSAEQHKYGPFAPIRAEIRRLGQERSTTHGDPAHFACAKIRRGGYDPERNYIVDELRKRGVIRHGRLRRRGAAFRSRLGNGRNVACTFHE